MSKQHYGKKNKKSNVKFSEIAEILGILESSNKGRDWLIREIRRHKVKVSLKSTMNSFEILRSCNDDFVSHILCVLENNEVEDPGDIKTLTRTYHWFFTDIVGSANPTILTKDQARKVVVLNELLGRTEIFSQRDPKSDVMSITGDGMVIGFSDSPEKPLRLAIELLKSISKYNKLRKGKQKLNIRIGIDTGPVYFIKDVTGKDNFWGPGIIMARRVMDLARPMQILASSRIANDIRKLSPEYKSTIHPIGDYRIKHGEKLSLFNVYGEGWGNKLKPEGQQDSENIELAPNPRKYLFPKIDVQLEVVNSKTMLTHHTWLWNVVNITENPIDQVSYILEGDVPKDFADLNVTITDEKNEKLKIISLNVNKPLKKEFIVRLNRPLRSNQQRRMLKLEYDWEEPERHFVYNLASDCKRFRYVFRASKKLDIKQRVLRVDPATQAKTHASPGPDVKYLKDKVEVIWQAKNLKAYESYRFEW